MSLSNGELLLASQVRALATELREKARATAWEEESFLACSPRFEGRDAASFIREVVAQVGVRPAKLSPQDQLRWLTFTIDWENRNPLSTFVPDALSCLTDVAVQIRQVLDSPR